MLVRTLLLTGFLCLAASCSPVAQRRTPTPDAMAVVLREYVAAVASGQYDRALALRCRDREVAEEDRRQFEDEVRRLLAEAAPIDVSDVPALTGSEPRGAGRVTYALVSRHGPSEPMVADILMEGGRLVVCGWTPLAVVNGDRVAPPLDRGSLRSAPGTEGRCRRAGTGRRRRGGGPGTQGR